MNTMGWQAISGNLFFTVALPLILTFVFATWFATRSKNKRLDALRQEMNAGFDALSKDMRLASSRWTSVSNRSTSG